MATPLVNFVSPWRWDLSLGVSHVAYPIKAQLENVIGPCRFLVASVPAFAPENPQGFPALPGRSLVLVPLLALGNITSQSTRTSAPILAAEGCSPTGASKDASPVKLGVYLV